MILGDCLRNRFGILCEDFRGIFAGLMFTFFIGAALQEKKAALRKNFAELKT